MDRLSISAAVLAAAFAVAAVPAVAQGKNAATVADPAANGAMGDPTANAGVTDPTLSNATTTTTASSTADTAGNSMADANANPDQGERHDFPWGLLGLAGLAGLAGLKRRDDDVRVNRTTTNDRH